MKMGKVTGTVVTIICKGAGHRLRAQGWGPGRRAQGIVSLTFMPGPQAVAPFEVMSPPRG